MKVHCRMKLVLGWLLLAVSAALFAAEPEPDLFADIGRIEADLSAITGLQFKHDVPYAIIGRGQLRSYLEDRMKESLKPEDVRAEELTLKMLGLIPGDYDLRKATVDLLTEQAAAFYDYHKKKLFVLENNTGPEAKMALMHELAHALADQHFHLEKFIHEGARNDDGDTARLAVMEGQASWLMTACLSKQSGGPPEVLEPILKLMQSSLESGAAEYPVFSTSPLYIRESLVFPYAQGLAFQDEVFRKMGRDSFGYLFQRAPVSTHQILHPSAYLDQAVPAMPALPRLQETKGLHALAGGTLGELDYRVLLTDYIGKEEAEPAAAHLSGSVYQLAEQKRDKRPVLAFISTWDSPAAARTFLQLYHRVLEKKWKKTEIERETETSLEGLGDSGYFRVSLEGATVSTVEGWPSPLH
jgi:hypothetical protein